MAVVVSSEQEYQAAEELLRKEVGVKGDGIGESPVELEDSSALGNVLDVMYRMAGGLPTAATQEKKILGEVGEDGLSAFKEMEEFIRERMSRGLLVAERTEKRIAEHQSMINVLLGMEKPAGMSTEQFEELRGEQIRLRQAGIEAAMRRFEKRLTVDRDTFLAVHAAEMKEYIEQRFERDNGYGIVHIPQVKESLTKVLNDLESGRPALLYGHTGSGKTEILKIAARTFSGQEGILVRCSEFMGPEELFAHVQLAKEGVKLEELPQAIDGAMIKVRELYPDATEEKLVEYQSLIEQALTHQGAVTVTKTILGAVYRAAEEGRVLILDEIPYMPAKLRAKLNDIMTKRPGDKIDVQEDGLPPIEVKKGFGIVFSANLNTGKNKSYNTDDLDQAFSDRVDKIRHDYPPQAAEKGLREVKDPLQKQLFMILVASLAVPGESVDRPFRLSLPGGDLDALWRLSQFAVVANRARFGEIADSDSFAYQRGGANRALKISGGLSTRVVDQVLHIWKRGGFYQDLDKILYTQVVERGVVKEEEKDYLYQLLRKCGFCCGKEWPQEPMQPEKGEVVFGIKPPADQKCLAEELQVIPGQDVVEGIYGDAPARTRYPASVSGDAQVVTNQGRALRQGALASSIQPTTSFARIQEIMEKHHNFIGPDDYDKEFGITVGGVPLPPEITVDYLQSVDPMDPLGRTIAETHILAFIPAEVSVNQFKQMAIDTGKKPMPDRDLFYNTGYDYTSEPWAKTALTHGRWVLVRREMLEGSQNKTDEAQQQVLADWNTQHQEAQYEDANAIDMIFSAMMKFLKYNERDFKAFYGRCDELIADQQTSNGRSIGRRVCVGYFYHNGLNVDWNYHSNQCDYLGRAVRRKFSLPV